MRCEVYVYLNNAIAHIIDESFPITPDANTTRIIVFDASTYPTESDFIRSHNMLWDGANLRHDGNIYLSAAWIAARLAEANQASTIASAKSGLKDKIALAQTHADTIKVLFNAVLDQTINQTVQPTRFTDLRTIITNAVPAFRDRVVTDIQQELGFDVTGNLTLAQQRQATLYMRAWVTGMALLLTLA